METLNLIFIGSSLNSKNISHTPSSDQITEWRAICDKEISVIFVDPNYHYHAISISTDEKVIEEKEKIEDLTNMEDVGFFHGYYYFSQLEFGQTEEVIYISYTKDCKDPYDVMYLVNDYDTDTKYYFCNVENIEDIIKLYTNKKLKKNYNIYSSNKLTDDLYKNKIYELYADACDIIINYFDAQLDKKDIPIKNIPFYSYNSELQITKGLIKYYELYPKDGNEIHRPWNEMCESDNYRKTIFLLLCKMVANFAYENNLLKESDIKYMEKFGWKKIETYKLILKKFV